MRKIFKEVFLLIVACSYLGLEETTSDFFRGSPSSSLCSTMPLDTAALWELGWLREQGVLTEEEFAEQKCRVLQQNWVLAASDADAAPATSAMDSGAALLPQQHLLV